MRYMLNSLVSRGLAVKKVIEEVDSVGLVWMIMVGIYDLPNLVSDDEGFE